MVNILETTNCLKPVLRLRKGGQITIFSVYIFVVTKKVTVIVYHDDDYFNIYFNSG